MLYPFTLRDTLLRLAELGLFEPYWSERILDEVRRNLIANEITQEQADHLIAAMTEAFDGAVVPEEQILVLEPHMGNHEKDRHVLAAAKAIGAERIVTTNLKDFSPDACDPLGIEAIHPDEFLLVLYGMTPDGVTEAIRHQAASLVNPPATVEEILERLSRVVPAFADAVHSAWIHRFA